MGDKPDLELEPTLNLDDPEAKLTFVREVAAMANSGGGTIMVGVGADGTEVGESGTLLSPLDSASLGHIVDQYVSPDRVKLSVERRGLADGGGVVVAVEVAPAVEPPIVLSKAGNFQRGEGKQHTVFPANAVFVRRNAKVRPARRDDYRRWTSDAVESATAQILERLAMVVEAPSGARIRVIAEEEVQDEPSYFLSRSADLFGQRPDRLLDGNDLRYLWTHRRSLGFDDISSGLVFQSALRKRATLFLWLSWLDLSEAKLTRYLWNVLDMDDRDKSDAGRSMLQVASLYLSPAGYQDLQEALAESRYTHMREAAKEWPTIDQGREAVDSVRNAELAGLGEEALHAMADELLAGSGQQLARRLTPIGLELLSRVRTRRPGS